MKADVADLLLLAGLAMLGTAVYLIGGPVWLLGACGLLLVIAGRNG